MTLRELQYIVAVADAGSFSRAALAVHVSQPTLSSQVRKLEDTLGVTIFERAPRRVLPTQAGEVLVAHARRVLEEADHLRTAARALRDPLSGRFRLGAIPTVAGYLFPDLVPEVSRDLPDLRLVLVEEKTDVLVERLRAGRLDAAVLALPVPGDALESAPLFTDPFYLAVSPGDPLAGRSSVRAGELSGESLLLLEDGHCLRDQSLAVCELTGADEDADLRATSLETLRQMVIAGTGRTLMPEIAVPAASLPTASLSKTSAPKGKSDGAAGDGLRYIPFEGESMSRDIVLAWRPSHPRGEVIARVAAMLRR